MQLEVCICTHNPRKPVFQKCINALANQTLNKSHFHVLIIDNASTEPLSSELFEAFKSKNVEYRVLSEPRLGNFQARITAIREAKAELITFIDDDIETPPDFLEKSLQIMNENPDVGCIGPRILLHKDVIMPDWLYPLRGYFAIIDENNFGMQPIKEFVIERWSPAEPPTAAATLRRLAVIDFLQYENSQVVNELGRKGRNSKHIFSCEDSLMLRPIHKRGFKCSFQPTLYVWHHLNPEKFAFRYCLRLFFGYGMSIPFVQYLTGFPMEAVPLRKLLSSCFEEMFGQHHAQYWRARLLRCAWWYGAHKRTMQLLK